MIFGFLSAKKYYLSSFSSRGVYCVELRICKNGDFRYFRRIGIFEHFPVNRQFEATECVKTSFKCAESTSHVKLALSLHFELSTCNILKICILSHMAYSYPWPWTWEIRVLKLKKPANWLLGQNFLCQQQSGVGLIRVNLGWLVDPAYLKEVLTHF